MEPREIIRHIENYASLPVGKGDRFVGYAVIGQPFRSGHVLALRRFPASSVGPGYTSVWHRDPQGAWTFYSTVVPEQACSRYFGCEITRNIVTPIEIQWISPKQFRVNIEKVLQWDVYVTESLASRVLNSCARLMPEVWWQKKFMLKLMGIAARFALGTGRMNLAGRTPNGQEFIANPQQVWMIDSSYAVLRGADLGPVGALERQAHLNDFLIPQRGMFAVTRAFLDMPTQTANGRSEMAPVLQRVIPRS